MGKTIFVPVSQRFSELQDGETFRIVRSDWRRYIKVKESDEYNAVCMADSSICIFIREDEQCISCGEIWKRKRVNKVLQ